MMGGLLMFVGGLLMVVGFLSHVFLLYEAYRESSWKAVAGFLCGLYLLYFGIAELEHEYKWPAIIAWLVAYAAGAALWAVGKGM